MPGDYLDIEAENINPTMYQNFQRSLYGISGGRVGTLSGHHMALILEPTKGQYVVVEDI